MQICNNVTFHLFRVSTLRLARHTFGIYQHRKSEQTRCNVDNSNRKNRTEYERTIFSPLETTDPEKQESRYVFPGTFSWLSLELLSLVCTTLHCTW